MFHVKEVDQVEAKLRRGIVHRHNPAFHVAYDDRRPFPKPRLLAAIQRYDRNLFFRLNVATGLWEMWRWFGVLIPRRRCAVSPTEMVQRAGFLFKICDPDTGEPQAPDWNLFRRLVAADRWAVGQYTGDQAADAMDSDTAKIERRKAAANREFTDDWAKDNKSQIRSLIGGQTIISTPR